MESSRNRRRKTGSFHLGRMLRTQNRQPRRRCKSMQRKSFKSIQKFQIFLFCFFIPTVKVNTVCMLVTESCRRRHVLPLLDTCSRKH